MSYYVLLPHLNLFSGWICSHAVKVIVIQYLWRSFALTCNMVFTGVVSGLSHQTGSLCSSTLLSWCYNSLGWSTWEGRQTASQVFFFFFYSALQQMRNVTHSYSSAEAGLRRVDSKRNDYFFHRCNVSKSIRYMSIKENKLQVVVKGILWRRSKSECVCVCVIHVCLGLRSITFTTLIVPQS